MSFSSKDAIGTLLVGELCRSNGVSGYEDETAEIIIKRLVPFCDSVMKDAVGNIIAFRKGKSANAKKIMLCAHMDEVGFAVKHINPDGTLDFEQVGMESVVLPSKKVTVGRDRIPGVISSRPVHLIKDREKPSPVSDLVIDIGAKNADEARELNLLGQSACFDVPFEFFGNGLVAAKALDDRIGCAVLCLVAQEQYDDDFYYVFTVGEELGGVGAAVATARVKPDVCVVAEGTTASDVEGVSGKDKVCSLKGGAVCPFMDGGTLYNNELYTCIHEYAKAQGIKIQVKTKVAGGTDAAKIQRSLGGIRTAVISLPCRYIHSGSSVAALEDMQSVYRLFDGLCRHRVI